MPRRQSVIIVVAYILLTCLVISSLVITLTCAKRNGDTEIRFARKCLTDPTSVECSCTSILTFENEQECIRLTMRLATNCIGNQTVMTGTCRFSDSCHRIWVPFICITAFAGIFWLPFTVAIITESFLECFRRAGTAGNLRFRLPR